MDSGRKAGRASSEVGAIDLGDRLPQLAPVAVELHDALTEALDAMRMQEGREAGAFLIPQDTAHCIWEQAKVRALAAVAAHGKLYEGTGARLSVPEFVTDPDGWE